MQPSNGLEGLCVTFPHLPHSWRIIPFSKWFWSQIVATSVVSVKWWLFRKGLLMVVFYSLQIQKKGLDAGVPKLWVSLKIPKHWGRTRAQTELTSEPAASAATRKNQLAGCASRRNLTGTNGFLCWSQLHLAWKCNNRMPVGNAGTAGTVHQTFSSLQTKESTIWFERGSEVPTAPWDLSIDTVGHLDLFSNRSPLGIYTAGYDSPRKPLRMSSHYDAFT